MPELLYAAVVAPVCVWPVVWLARTAAPWIKRMHQTLNWPERIGIALMFLMGVARMALAVVAGV